MTTQTDQPNRLQRQLAAAMRHAPAARPAPSSPRRELTFRPEYADALGQCGLATVRADWSVALDCLERAARHDSHSLEELYRLAAKRKAEGDFPAAIDAFERVLAVEPQHVRALFKLAVALEQSGRVERAVAITQRLVVLDPLEPGPRQTLAALLVKQKRIDEAIEVWNSFTNSMPESAEGFRRLADLLALARRSAEAIVAYRRAAQIDPHDVHAHAMIADLAERSNDVLAARQAAERGCAVSPGDPRCRLVLAKLARRAGHPEEALMLLDIGLDKPDDPLLERAVAFERARNYDRSGQFEPAFQQFQAANAIEVPDSFGRLSAKDEFTRLLDRLHAVATPEWLAEWNPAPDLPIAKSPIFLVGFPRSGTTLLGHILDCHPQLQTLHEAPALFEVQKMLARTEPGYPDAIADLTVPQVEQLRAAYWKAVDRHIEREPGTTLVDKMPMNLAHAALIVRLFPNARFLFIARHPCDACLSCFMQDFKSTHAMAHFATLEDTASQYRRLMDLWLRWIELFNLEPVCLRYETLVANFESTLRRIVNQLGVGWNAAVLEYASDSAAASHIQTPSYEQITQPLYRSACGRWKNYAEHFDTLLETLEPLIECLGYEL